MGFILSEVYPSDGGLFSLLSLFWKNEVGLWDHISIHVCVCLCISPLLTFERLDQSLWNLAPETISTA
jgi:hypothetical protein